MVIGKTFVFKGVIVKVFLLFAAVLLFAVPGFSQWVTHQEAEDTVKSVLSKIVPAYGTVEDKHGYYELEFKLIYNGMIISGAEKNINKSSEKTTEELLQEFKEELDENLAKAKITHTYYDREDNEWEIQLFLPNIDISDIDIDGTTGRILPD